MSSPTAQGAGAGGDPSASWPRPCSVRSPSGFGGRDPDTIDETMAIVLAALSLLGLGILRPRIATGLSSRRPAIGRGASPSEQPVSRSAGRRGGTAGERRAAGKRARGRNLRGRWPSAAGPDGIANQQVLIDAPIAIAPMDQSAARWAFWPYGLGGVASAHRFGHRPRPLSQRGRRPHRSPTHRQRAMPHGTADGQLRLPPGWHILHRVSTGAPASAHGCSQPEQARNRLGTREYRTQLSMMSAQGHRCPPVPWRCAPGDMAQVAALPFTLSEGRRADEKPLQTTHQPFTAKTTRTPRTRTQRPQV